MPMNIAVQMDPIETINIVGDSTFALMLECQRRGHRLFYYQPGALALRDGRLSAEGRDVTVRDEVGRHAELGPLRRVDLATFDVVLMRQDPPFDMNYITATHLLEWIVPAVLVVNDPAEVRNAPEKLFVTHFRTDHGDIILKPLYGNGGAGIFRLAHADENFAALLELFSQTFREPFIAQKYLPEVRKGDKRIILVEGEPVGAINRVPAVGESRSNMHVGGRAEPTELSDRDREICARIGPDLRSRGLIFVGIDVIGDWLTEINVTSPTGIREVARFGGADIAAAIVDAIEARLATPRSAP